MANRRSIISLIIDGKNRAGKALKQAQSQVKDVTSTIGSGFSSAAGRVKDAIFSVQGFVTALAGLAALRIARDLFTVGSAAEEIGSKFRTVFGPAVDEVNEFIDRHRELLGLTTSQAQDLLATNAAIIQGLGGTREAAADLSTQILSVAGDLGSFNNVPTADVAQRITRALTGERESLKLLGIAFSEEEVTQRALLDTGKAHESQLTRLDKAFANVAIVADRAGVAVGDLERTQDSAANTARRVTTAFAQQREEIGKELLPLFAQLLGAVDDNRGALFLLSDSVKFVLQQFRLFIAEVQLFGHDIARLTVLIQNDWELIKGATKLLVADVREFFADLVTGIRARVASISVTATETWDGLRDGAEIAVGAVIRAFGQLAQRASGILGALGIDVSGFSDSLIESGQGLIDAAIESQAESARAAAQARADIRDALAEGDEPDPELEAIRTEARQQIASAVQARQTIQEEFARVQDEILAGAISEVQGGGAVPIIDLEGPDSGDLDAAQQAMQKLKAVGQETQQALDVLSVKAAVLGDAFDPVAERASILRRALDAATDAGLGMESVIPGIGRTVESLKAEYTGLGIEIAEAAEQERLFTEDQRLVQSLIASGQTELDKYVAVVRRLTFAFEEGRISQEQFTMAMQAAEENFRTGADSLEKRSAELVRNVNTSVENALNSALVGLGQSLGTLLADSAKGMQSLSNLVLGVVGSLLQAVGQALVAFGTAGVAIKSFISNPVAAIAAGVAMIALGSALTSSVQGSVATAGTALSTGATFAPGAAPGGASAGAGISPELVAAGGGSITLVIQGGILDMSDPRQERALADAFEQLTGRRVIIETRD